MELSDIIIEPLVTEKSIREQEQKNQYTFVVHPDSNKIEIREAIQKQFNVVVEDVRTMNVSGKQRTVRGIPGETSDWKKAIVKLEEGNNIEVVEGLVG